MLVDEIVAHVEKEAVLLNAHFKFLAAFNKRRCQILEEKKHSETQYHLIRPRAAHARSDGIFHSALMGIDACEAMANFVQDSYVPLTEFLVEDNVLHACLQGENIAKAFVHWSRLVKWPPDIQPDYNMHTKGDWGVSWFELLVSFYLTTGFSLSYQVEWVQVHSQSTLIMGMKRRHYFLTVRERCPYKSYVSGIFGKTSRRWFKETSCRGLTITNVSPFPDWDSRVQWLGFPADLFFQISN